MLNATEMTVRGYISSEPRLRFTQKNTPAVRTLVVTPSQRIDHETGRWVPDLPQLTVCTALGQLALDMAEILEDGTPVTITGTLDCIEGDFIFLDVLDVAISLRNGLRPAAPWKAEPSDDARRLPTRAPTTAPALPASSPPAESLQELPPLPAGPPPSALPAAPSFPWVDDAEGDPDWLFTVCSRAQKNAADR